MDLNQSLQISASGMKAQSARMRVVAQNIANADSTGIRPGEEPYRRKTITFQNVLDKTIGAEVVAVAKTGEDPSDFKARFDPTHPAANAEGYVLMPNVNSTMELMDMKEAQRTYEANLSAVEATKTMLQQTIGMLR